MSTDDQISGISVDSKAPAFDINDIEGNEVKFHDLLTIWDEFRILYKIFFFPILQLF
ncbi:MAG: hypothetical protein R6U96_06210 [Promethearchaeia archaeon]